MVFAKTPSLQELPVVTTVAQLADTLQTLFTTAADQAAREAGFIRRQRKLSGASFAQALVFSWLDNPDATLEDLASATGLQPGSEPLTAQALEERFNDRAADCLRRLLLRAARHVLAATPSQAGLLRRFAGVHVRDSTVLALPAALAELWPGCGGGSRDQPDASCQAALKIHVCWELRTAALQELTLAPGRQADNLLEQQAGAAQHQQQLPLPPKGSLRLADLGFFDLEQLQALDQQGVYYVSRLQANTRILDLSTGKKWTLAAYLASRRSDRVDRWVQAGSGRRLLCRLLAIRAPEAVAARRRRQVLEQARDHGRAVSPQRLEVCGWTVFISNVPWWLLRLQEAWVLYRLRWQVELLFKLWKAQGKIDESRSEKPYRVLCEVYAKLLAMVVEHWLLLTEGPGSSERSRWKAARLVRRQAWQLACALTRPKELRRLLRLLQRLLHHSGRVNRRRRRPSAYQTVLDPIHDGLT
jgi:hypothetical protein